MAQATAPILDSTGRALPVVPFGVCLPKSCGNWVLGLDQAGPSPLTHSRPLAADFAVTHYTVAFNDVMVVGGGRRSRIHPEAM
jgi:hypothetical protein